MICGGSPCQDFSVAGKQKGSVWECKDCGHTYNPLMVHWSERDKCPNCHSENLDKSRSSLLVEWLRIIRANHPKFGIYENVKNIVGKQFKPTFDLFVKELEEYGYNVYWKVLNAKNYGIPQNRERVYVVLVQKELDNGLFNFPEPLNDRINLKDMLEDKVEEKYYMNTEKLKKLIETLINNGTISGQTDRRTDGQTDRRTDGQTDRRYIVDGSICKPTERKVANCITARENRGISNQQSTGNMVVEQQ